MSQHLTVVESTDKFLSEATKTVRMLSVLLTACDPCGYMRSGGSPHDYTELAWQVEAALRAGMGASQIKALMQRICDTENPARFCEAAVDWWARSGASHAAVA